MHMGSSVKSLEVGMKIVKVLDLNSEIFIIITFIKVKTSFLRKKNI